jgi:hypothetical protein
MPHNTWCCVLKTLPDGVQKWETTNGSPPRGAPSTKAYPTVTMAQTICDALNASKTGFKKPEGK